MQSQAEDRTPVEAPVRRRRLPVLAAAAGVAALAVGGGLLAADHVFPRASAGAVELSLPGTGADVSGSCLPFAVEYLAEMSPAFAGTVTDVSDDRAVLRVDRWYAGGSASEVVVTVPDGAHIALNGVIDLVEGRQYLITAEDGTVNLCGYSGEVTPELQAAFDAAF